MDLHSRHNKAPFTNIKFLVSTLQRLVHGYKTTTTGKIYKICFNSKSQSFSFLYMCVSVLVFQNDSASIQLRFSKVGWVQNKGCFVQLLLFVLFYHKNSAFFIFILFFDEASNFRSRISTNQKQKLGVQIQNCQWNCMRRLNL